MVIISRVKLSRKLWYRIVKIFLGKYSAVQQLQAKGNSLKWHVEKDKN